MVYRHAEDISKYTMGQLSLPFGSNETSLQDRFGEASGKTVSLTITDNSTSLLSIKAGQGISSVRLHRIFLHADDDVIGEIVSLIKRRKVQTPLIRDFIRRNSGYIEKGVFRKRTIKMQGKYFNLADIYKSINERYFGGRVSASITWSGRGSVRAARKRTLGSYNCHSNTIRISPILDKKSVPGHFIEFIVYHEMLHADMGVEMKNGRRGMHTREFRRRERLFSHHEKAVEWEKKNM
jgi:hypothetical protein